MSLSKAATIIVVPQLLALIIGLSMDMYMYFFVWLNVHNKETTNTVKCSNQKVSRFN